ncbi:B3 domain-containing protein REM10-like [Cornus florida]|uniref:B3 domain-containing protein REM10-like n=1 Tax=Cornus florida TaxID=4283 RepID=UPI00289A7C74|nr:B3 domain-containing protein REM10-like [Cornus florida]
MARPKAEASPFALGDHPSFVSTLRRYSFECSMLYIPMDFAKQNGLINRSCEMILRSQQRSWKVSLQSKKNDGTHVYLRRGWRDFCIENGLKEGDTFRFELSKNGKVPIMYFHRLQGTSPRSNLVSSTGPYFVATFSRNSLKWSTLCIPKKFAMSNGLIDIKCCKIVIIDPKGRPWSMSLKHKKQCLYIRGCWGQFAKSNDLKEGDTFKLQLIKGRNTLTMNFYPVSSDHEKAVHVLKAGRSHKLAASLADQN